jgi:hypothetical protein
MINQQLIDELFGSGLAAGSGDNSLSMQALREQALRSRNAGLPDSGYVRNSERASNEAEARGHETQRIYNDIEMVRQGRGHELVLPLSRDQIRPSAPSPAGRATLSEILLGLLRR